MALTGYLQISDTVETINGEADTKDHEGWIEVFEFTMGGRWERNPADGWIGGKRSYDPVTFVKPVDSATAALYELFSGNASGGATQRRIGKAVFQLYRNDSDGHPEPCFKVTLTNAYVAGIQTSDPSTEHETNNAKKMVDKVQLVFEAIEWETLTSGKAVTKNDDWKRGKG